jgi:hypothetical protein
MDMIRRELPRTKRAGWVDEPDRIEADMERLVKPFGLTVSKPRLVLFREEGSQAFCLGKQNW